MATFLIGHKHSEPITMSQFRDLGPVKRRVKYISTNAYPHILPDNSSTSTSSSSKNKRLPLSRLKLKTLARVVIKRLNINIFKENDVSLRSLVPIAKLPRSCSCSRKLDNPESARQRRKIHIFDSRLRPLSRVRNSPSTFVSETYPFKYHNTKLGVRNKLKVIVPETFDMMNDAMTDNFCQSDSLKLVNRRSKYLHVRMYYRNLPNASCKFVCTPSKDAHLLVNRLRLNSLGTVILDRLNINLFQDNRIRLRSAFPLAKRLTSQHSNFTGSSSSMRKSSQHNERPNPYNRIRGSDKDVISKKFISKYDSTGREYCTKLIVRVPKRFVRIKDSLTNNVSKMEPKALPYPNTLEKQPKPSQLIPKRAPLRFQPRHSIPENTKDARCILNDFGHCNLKNFVNYMLWKENELCTTDMTTDLSL